jgi:hypothetical protein
MSLDELMGRARLVRTDTDGIGIGSASADGYSVVFTDFAAPVKTGIRPTGIVFPDRTIIKSSRLVVEQTMVGSFSAYIGVPGQVITAAANLSAGTIQPIDDLVVVEGGELILTSISPVTAGKVLLLLEHLPLG